ncbi:MAG: ABC transporter substrate-binding protein [Humibacter sp.]
MYQRRRTTRALVVALAALTALGLAGCARGATPAGAASAAAATATPKELTTVKVGITGATAPPTFLPLIAQSFGLDREHNIDIKFVTIAPNVTAQTLSQGAVDILASPSVETAILQGAKFKVIAGAAKDYWRFVASDSIKNWSDLAGKKVALPCGQAATCNAFMVDLLKAHKVDPSTVTFIFGTGQATYEALAAGSVDAALTTAPYTYALETAGKTHQFDITDAPDYLSTMFTSTDDYINGHPEVISAFVDTMVQAEKKLSTQPTDPKVLTAINDFESANGIDPATLDQKRFLTEFANDGSWQLVPTKKLITQDLAFLAANPTTAAAAKAATFDQMVSRLPAFEGKYE